MTTPCRAKALSVLVLAFAASHLGAMPSGDSLDEAVRSARTVEIQPQKTLPSWMDYDRLSRGYAFAGAHRGTIANVLMGSSLASTFAAKDVAPVLMQTGKLAKSFAPRMMSTGLYMNGIMSAPKNQEVFLSRNYAQAVSLGELHREVAEGVREPLRWDPKVRVPMNAQSYAFVLYSFAWWPVEAMIATHEIDPAKDAQALDDWFHLWSVVGYGMGVPESLLPRDYPKAKDLVARLRKAQYSAPGESVPEGVPTLLGGHVRMLAGMAAARTKTTAAEATPGTAMALAEQIKLSPGLAEALGLGKDPAEKLAGYAALPTSK